MGTSDEEDDNQENVKIMGNYLDGEAKTWFEAVEDCCDDWATLRHRFIERFDNIDTQVRISAAIFKAAQGKITNLTSFIKNRMTLFKRLKYTRPSENVQIQMIIALLDVEQRRQLAAMTFKTFLDVLSYTECLDRENKTMKYIPPARRPATDKPQENC